MCLYARRFIKPGSSVVKFTESMKEKKHPYSS